MGSSLSSTSSTRILSTLFHYCLLFLLLLLLLLLLSSRRKTGLVDAAFAAVKAKAATTTTTTGPFGRTTTTLPRTTTTTTATPSIIVSSSRSSSSRSSDHHAPPHPTISRRNLLLTTCTATCGAFLLVPGNGSAALAAVDTTTTTAMTTTTMASTTSAAATTTTTSSSLEPSASNNNNNPMTTINQLLQRLHDIPTFCIVSPNDDGASYMLYKNDQAMAVGYAFTTFTGALAVLGDAQRNAKEKGYEDIWNDATITIIPMDIAVRLALKKKSRTTPKQQTLDTLVQIIPGADEKQDGMAIDSKFRDQSKVPLFYVKELQQQQDDSNKNDNGAAVALPLFFSRKDLFNSWSQQHPGVPLPTVQAVDLTGIFESILRGRTDYLPTTNLVFVPSQEAVQVAKEMKARGQLPPYNPNRMII